MIANRAYSEISAAYEPIQPKSSPQREPHLTFGLFAVTIRCGVLRGRRIAAMLILELAWLHAGVGLRFCKELGLGTSEAHWLAAGSARWWMAGKSAC